MILVTPSLVYSFGSVYHSKTGTLDSENDVIRAMDYNERSKLLLESITKTNRVWYLPELLDSIPEYLKIVVFVRNVYRLAFVEVDTSAGETDGTISIGSVGFISTGADSTGVG